MLTGTGVSTGILIVGWITFIKVIHVNFLPGIDHIIYNYYMFAGRKSSYGGRKG
jgi:hypothetical protein